MKDIKSLNIIRSLASLPIFIILLIMLIGGSVVASALSLVADSSNTKEWIENAGLYEEAPELAVQYTFSRIGFEGARDPLIGFLSEDELREKVREIFPPEWIKGTAEGIIDSIYESLNNPGSDIAFSIDLSGKEEKIRGVLSDVFRTRVAGLPPCRREIEDNLEEINLFEVSCLPQNINRDAAYDKIDREITSIKPFSENSEETIVIGGSKEEGGSAGRTDGGLKGLVSALPSVLLLFAATALLLHALLYFLFPGRKGKLIVFSALWGITSITIFLVAAFLFAGFALAYNAYILTNIPAEASIAVPFVEKILLAVRSSLAIRLFIVGLIFAVLSAITIYKLRKEENGIISNRKT